MTFSGKTAARCAAAALALCAVACGDKNASSTSPTVTPAAPTVTERYVGTLSVGGSGFYSFSVPQYGTVNATLTSVTGASESAVLGLGLGVPSGFGCSTRTTTSTGPGADAQVTDTYDPGIYCVRVYDVGNLTGSATFDVTIAHP